MESLVPLPAIVVSACSSSTCHLACRRGVLVIPYPWWDIFLRKLLSCRLLNISREIDLENFGVVRLQRVADCAQSN